jgi:hypothetical protein
MAAERRPPAKTDCVFTLSYCSSSGFEYLPSHCCHAAAHLHDRENIWPNMGIYINMDSQRQKSMENRLLFLSLVLSSHPK